MSRKEKNIRQTTKDQEKPRIVKRKEREKNAVSTPFVRLSELPFILIILAYIFSVTFTPNWMALDTNAPKFLTLSMVNFVAFIVLLNNRSIRNNPGSLLRFFTTNIGFAYSGFLILSLLSFTQAINLRESILQFAKLFSVFSATFILAVILMHNMRLVKLIVIVMTGLLIFDAVSVFYNINLYIDGKIGSITDIKTVYSNKNILASSLYVKLPFALWLLIFEKGWLRRIGWLSLSAGVLATFFMSTRAFYLGLVVISLGFITYNVFYFFKKRENKHLKLAGVYLVAVLVPFFIFSFVQSNLYPKDEGRLTQGIATQIATIKDEAGEGSVRLNSLRWSWKLIKEHPVLGVGSGNWKINILKHENQTNTGFIYIYKAHNDFIENMTETGIVGGLLFFFLFVFAGWNFIRQYRLRSENPDYLYAALFLAASGMVFYAVDAAFNFPADRPEILLLFILFLSTAIAAASYQKTQIAMGEAFDTATTNTILSAGDSQKSPKKDLLFFFAFAVIVLMAFFVYIFKINFESVKLQRVVYQEIMSGRLKEPSTRFVGKFPSLPDISIWGESIPAITARYLLEENKNKETIELLLPDESNPYDSRREFFLAMAYNNLGNVDSALFFTEQAYIRKPNYFRNLHLMLTLLEQKKRDDDIPPYIDAYLAKQKKEVNAWLFGTGFYSRIGEMDKAYDLIKEALEYLPNDSLINQQERYLYHRKFVEPHTTSFNKAMEFFNSGNHKSAVDAFNDYLEKVPLNLNAVRMRAFSMYQLKEFNLCISSINEYLEKVGPDGQLYNLRGVAYSGLNENDKACLDYEIAMKMGDSNGKINYDRFCRQNN